MSELIQVKRDIQKIYCKQWRESKKDDPEFQKKEKYRKWVLQAKKRTLKHIDVLLVRFSPRNNPYMEDLVHV